MLGTRRSAVGEASPCGASAAARSHPGHVREVGSGPNQRRRSLRTDRRATTPPPSPDRGYEPGMRRRTRLAVVASAAAMLAATAAPASAQDDEVVGVLQDLVRLSTSNPPGNEQ